MNTNVDFVTFSNILRNQVNSALRYTDGLCIENVVLPGDGEVNVLIFPFKNGRWSANICGNKDDVIRALFVALNGKMP